MNQSGFIGDPLPTGRECELCHTIETDLSPLSTFHLDRDPSNSDPGNLAIVCPFCFRHLLLAMPEGIAKSRTMFAFLINRGAYSREQTMDYLDRARSQDATSKE